MSSLAIVIRPTIKIPMTAKVKGKSNRRSVRCSLILNIITYHFFFSSKNTNYLYKIIEDTTDFICILTYYSNSYHNVKVIITSSVSISIILIVLSSNTATVALLSSRLLSDGEPGFKNTVFPLFSKTLICT